MRHGLHTGFCLGLDSLASLVPEDKSISSCWSAQIEAGMQIDIFSLGILLREMVTGEIPQPYQMREQLASLVPGHDCSADTIALIRECCAGDPKQRPSAELAYDRLMAR